MAGDTEVKGKMAKQLKEQVETAYKQSEEYIKLTEEYKRRLAADFQEKQAKELEVLAKEGRVPHGSGEIEIGEKVKQSAIAGVRSEQNAFHDWRANMNALLQMAFDRIDWLTHIHKGNLLYVEQTLAGGFFALKEQLGYNVPEMKKLQLPDLHYLYEYSDANGLETHKLESTNGVNLNGMLDGGLKVGGNDWLNKEGYEKDPATNHYVSKADGSRLTKAEFDRRRDDPTTGLKAYLSGEEPELTFNPRPM